MHIAVESEMLCGCERHTGCCNSFDCRVACKVDEKYRSVDSTRLFEVGNEEVSFFECDTDSGKYNRKLFVLSANLSLTCYLCGKVSVRQTRAREYRELLSAHEGIKSVDR